MCHRLAILLVLMLLLVLVLAPTQDDALGVCIPCLDMLVFLLRWGYMLAALEEYRASRSITETSYFWGVLRFFFSLSFSTSFRTSFLEGPKWF